MEKINLDKFYYTVRELIEILKGFPQDLPVITSGYENGFENFHQPEIVQVIHEPENMYYAGEFQLAEKDIKESFQAVAIMRVVRDD